MAEVVCKIEGHEFGSEKDQQDLRFKGIIDELQESCLRCGAVFYRRR